MLKYKKLENLPVYENLLEELVQLINAKNLIWGKFNQICLNTTESETDNYQLGVGSLDLDWNNITNVENHGITQFLVQRKEKKLNIKDFSCLCTQFQGTIFETIYDSLRKNYNIGRVRLMKSQPHTCLSWHRDATPRLHFPIKTQFGCIMVVEDQAFHLNQNQWWWVNTKLHHTAFNGSNEARIHLVVEIIE